MSDKPEWVQKLEAEPCECRPCPICNGRGNVYWLLGKYVGPHHPCDDLADLEPCECCDGGIVELCDRCAGLNDYETWERTA